MQGTFVAHNEQPVAERCDPFAARKALGVVTQRADACVPESIATLFGGCGIDVLAAQHDAIDLRRSGLRHEPAPHVSQHCLWIALERVAETTAALPAHRKYVATLHANEARLGAEGFPRDIARKDGVF